jgi:hypothetical protein
VPEDVLTPSEAAEKISDRPETLPTIERDYIKRDKDGQPVPVLNEDGAQVYDENLNPLFERESGCGFVTAEEAARDLAETRRAEAALPKEQEDLAVQRAVDALRSGADQSAVEPQQQQPAQQSESVEGWGPG